MNSESAKTFITLSEEEIDQFLDKIKLHRYKEGECRLEYLNKAVANTLEWIPFQTVFLHAIPLSERIPFTEKEVKYQLTTGQGGCCIVINPFFYSFLLSQGFEANLVHSSCRKIPNNHQCIIVENVLEKGDRYMVDVGNAFYNVPLKLDFEKRSPIQNLAFSSYYYEWEDDTKNVLKRIHLSDEFFQINTFVPFKNYEDLMTFQGELYTNENSSPACHKFLRMVRYLSTGAVIIKSRDLYIQNPQTNQLELQEQLNDLETFLKYSDQYFPMIDRNLIIVSYQNFFGTN